MSDTTSPEPRTPGPGWRARLTEHSACAKRWRSCSTWTELGEVTVAFLNGELPRSPYHGGPVDQDETGPFVPVLIAANRAGFITDNSQADPDFCTSVHGYLPGDGLDRMRRAIEGTPLQVIRWCRNGEHHGHRRLRPFTEWCHRDDWALDTRIKPREVDQAWHVCIEDPEPGRFDVLWLALQRFADGGK